MNAGFLEIINHGQEEKIRLLQNKVDLYSANLEQYKQKSYNETQVRVDFVNFFFQLLGWDVLNENGLPQHLREVTHEARYPLIDGTEFSLISFVKDFGKCLHFSIVTFSTVGYGNIVPSGISYIISAIQILIGVLFVALFTSIMLKKILR